MTATGSNPATDRENSNVPLGHRLRQARVEAGLSLRELARQVDVSASFISQIELGRASPSIGTLYAIVSELGLSLDTVMGQESASHQATVDTPLTDPLGVQPPAQTVNGSDTEAAADVPEQDGFPDNVLKLLPSIDSANALDHLLPPPGRASSVQRADQRPEINMDNVRWERLTNEDDHLVEFLRVTYRTGSESCPADNLMRHAGKEYIHILSGRLEVQVAFEKHTMEPGDSLNFLSSIPHRLSNPYDEDCVAIWVVVGRQAQENFPAH